MIFVRVCAPNQSQIDKVTKEGVYYKKNQYNSVQICVFEDHSLQQLCINWVSRGVITLKCSGIYM